MLYTHVRVAFCSYTSPSYTSYLNLSFLIFHFIKINSNPSCDLACLSICLSVCLCMHNLNRMYGVVQRVCEKERETGVPRTNKPCQQAMCLSVCAISCRNHVHTYAAVASQIVVILFLSGCVFFPMVLQKANKG